MADGNLATNDEQDPIAKRIGRLKARIARVQFCIKRASGMDQTKKVETFKEELADRKAELAHLERKLKAQERNA